jgi:hypothetical protein
MTAMMRRFLSFVLCAPLIGVLAGSALGEQRLPVPYEKELRFENAGFSSADGPHELRTAVYGNPFGIGEAMLQAGIIAAMQTTNWHWRAVKPNMTFVDGAGPADWRSLHVAVYLNSEALDDAKIYCAAVGNVEFDQAPEPLRVRMALCSGRELFSITVATLPDVSSANDAALHKLLAQMARGLWRLRYLGAQMGSSQVLLGYRQANLAFPELFSFGFNTVRKLIGPGGGLRRPER